MRRPLYSSIFSLAVTAVLPLAVVEKCLAQPTSDPAASQTGVVITKLSEPVYPLVARTAHISDDVVLTLGIGRDGSVESAVVVSGPALLQKVALESAQQSQFECRECTAAATSYSLIYTFQLGDCDCTAGANATTYHRDGQSIPRVIQSPNHVTITGKPECICDPAEHRIRSAKCLYLWRCGVQ